MSGRRDLERRYRRLLAVYPPGHRLVHGEEMLGVLMAAAPDGQRRPELADTVNLAWGALRIRFRAMVRGSGDPRWRDALAVLSVVTPLLLLAAGLAVNDILGVGIRAAGGSPENPFWLAYWWVWPSTLGPAVLVLLVLLRRRAAAALTALAVSASYVILSAHGPGADLVSPGTTLWLLLGGLATVALVFSPGPRRGLQILGWWRTALVGVGALALGALLWGDPFGQPAGLAWAWLAAIGGVPAAVVLACLRSPVGRRVMALLMISAPLGVGILAQAGVAAGLRGGTGPLALLLYLPPLLVIGLIVTAARLRRHRPGSRQDPPAGDAPA